MKRPTAIGLAFRMPRSIGAVGALLLLVVALALSVQLKRPVDAQTEYGLARQWRERGIPSGEETHLLRALEIDPWATGARSRYSEFLIEQGRPDEALEQLKLVRLRLNSTELWDRESRAYRALGEHDEARAAWLVYVHRLGAPLEESGQTDER